MASLPHIQKLAPTLGAVLLLLGQSGSPRADETTVSPPTVAVLKLAARHSGPDPMPSAPPKKT